MFSQKLQKYSNFHNPHRETPPQSFGYINKFLCTSTTGKPKNCDFVITVTAPIEICINRVIKRDKTTREHVLSRMNNQWLAAKKKIQSNYIIENVLLENTKKSVRKIHNILTKKQF